MESNGKTGLREEDNSNQLCLAADDVLLARQFVEKLLVITGGKKLSMFAAAFLSLWSTNPKTKTILQTL